jgi:tetratricopeptide (TPR) repeat protein
MNLFLRKLNKAFYNLLKIILVLGILFIVFLNAGTLFSYIIYGQAYYYVYLGDKAYKREDYQAAVEYYANALNIYPEHVKARYNLGNIFVAYEDFPGAMTEYQKALSYNPGYLNARISLGIIFAEEMLRYDEAIAEYKKVVESRSRIINIPLIYDNRRQIIKAKAVAYFNMGLAYRDKAMLFESDSLQWKKFLHEAALCYENSLALIKDNYDAQYNLALTRHLLGYYTEALTGYCKAMLIAPLNYEAHYNLAVLLRQQKQYDESVEELRNAGSMMSFSGDAYKAAFVFSMLNEVSQMAIAEHGFEPKKLVKKLNKKIEKETRDIVDLEDKTITAEEIEKAMIKRIKTASICKNYLEGHE